MQHLPKLAGVLVVTAIGLAGMPVGAQGSTAASGVMTLTFPGCPSDTVVVAGVNDGVAWDWLVADVNSDVPSFCVIGEGLVSSGPDPFTGGCGIGFPGGGLCLYTPSVSGSTVTYGAVKVCINDSIFGYCITGTGSLDLL